MIENYESGRTLIESLIEEFKKIDISKFNESDTRFRFIDRILIDCLGWSPKDINTEDFQNPDYADYKLNLFRPIAVWEAKRTGNYFELPVGFKNLICPIKTICKDNPNITNALKQVSKYCHERGIQIGVVTNGWQFIGFIANRNDSIPPLEGDAFVVPSLDKFLDNYKEVWNALSKTGFEEQYLVKKLLGDKIHQLPPKLSSTILDYPGVKNRNPFQADMEIISDLVLEDVIKEKSIEKDFLKDCYCKSGALSQYSLLSKEILSTRYHYLFDTNDKKAILEQVANKKGLSGDLLELFANSFSKRPILLIGDVGVGKSTFIDHLLVIDAAAIFEKCLTFKIDLGSKAIITIDIRNAIIRIIKDQLKDNYGNDIENDDFVRHCYYVDLENFKKNVRVKRLYEIDYEKALEKEIEYLTSLVDDSVTHLKRSLEFISKNQKKQIIIFIDNCDQRNDQDQETAFLIAQEFATDWPIIAFICLRPETFHRTKKISGALSGYHTKAFTISPPRIDEVIQKRLSFAQRIANGEITLSKLKMRTNFSKLHDLIQTFRNSLEENPDLFRFIENVSNGNVRKAIELIKKFFGSGHVDTEKILKIYEASGDYLIPLHELLRSVIFGDNIYFRSDNTDIVNLFDVRTYDPKEHFIVPLLLGLLHDNTQNNRNQGFVSINDLYSYLQSQGFNVDQIDATLNFMYSKGLFETSQKGNKLETDSGILMIRATTLGIYHICYMTNCFTYVDAIIIDTPIFDRSYDSKILDNPEIKDRLDRAQYFKEYLDSEWVKAGFSVNYYNWEKQSIELLTDINRIRSRFK
jgi:GTPase SAR1 family protein